MDVLKVSEIKTGQYITILSAVDGDRSWVGDVLEVKAVDLPFIVVDEVPLNIYKGIRLDTRRRLFKALSPEYVEAVCGGKKDGALNRLPR